MKKALLFPCPVAGEVAPISQCADPCFSQGLVGDGIMVFPRESTLYAPASGQLILSQGSEHLLGLSTPEGLELLIHMGLRTNRQKIQGIEPLYGNSTQVSRQMALLRFQPELLRTPDAPPQILFTFCNLKQAGATLELLRTGPVDAGEEIIRILWG